MEILPLSMISDCRLKPVQVIKINFEKRPLKSTFQYCGSNSVRNHSVSHRSHSKEGSKTTFEISTAQEGWCSKKSTFGVCQAQGFIANVGSFSILCCSAPQNNLQWGKAESPFPPAATLVLKQKASQPRVPQQCVLRIPSKLAFFFFLLWSGVGSVQTLLGTAQCRVHLLTPILSPPSLWGLSHTGVCSPHFSPPSPFNTPVLLA